MDYKVLGKTGVKVSSLCLGTMTFGEAADADMSSQLYSMCRDAGINFFDCANTYAKGESERILGKFIKGHRSEVLISTKGYYPMGPGVNDRGASRLHLTKALADSLDRLDTDYVDLYYIHHFDENVALEETLRTLDDFVKSGRVLYLGLSNFSAWQIMKAIGKTELNSLSGIACIQPMYSLLKRQCESEILPLAQSESLAVFPYSPLGGGMLTGKYINDNVDTDSRFLTSTMYQKRYEDQTNKEVTQSFTDYCKDKGYNPVSVAIAWAASHPDVTAPIIGARNIDQLRPALDSLDIDMTQELRSELSNLSLSPANATNRSEER